MLYRKSLGLPGYHLSPLSQLCNNIIHIFIFYNIGYSRHKGLRHNKNYPKKGSASASQTGWETTALEYQIIGIRTLYTCILVYFSFN